MCSFLYILTYQKTPAILYRQASFSRIKLFCRFCRITGSADSSRTVSDTVSSGTEISRSENDKVLRTRIQTFSAAGTVSFFEDSQSLSDDNCVLRTCFHTRSQPDTSLGTGSSAISDRKCSMAVPVPAILIYSRVFIKIAAAENDGLHRYLLFDCVFCQYFFRLFRRMIFGIRLTYLWLLHNHKQQTDYYADAEKNRCRNDNFQHITSSNRQSGKTGENHGAQSGCDDQNRQPAEGLRNIRCIQFFSDTADQQGSQKESCAADYAEDDTFTNIRTFRDTENSSQNR